MVFTDKLWISMIQQFKIHIQMYEGPGVKKQIKKVFVFLLGGGDIITLFSPFGVEKIEKLYFHSLFWGRTNKITFYLLKYRYFSWE